MGCSPTNRSGTYQTTLKHSFRFSWLQLSPKLVTVVWWFLHRLWSASCKGRCCIYTKAGMQWGSARDLDVQSLHWLGSGTWTTGGGSPWISAAPFLLLGERPQIHFLQLFELCHGIRPSTASEVARSRTHFALLSICLWRTLSLTLSPWITVPSGKPAPKPCHKSCFLGNPDKT